MFIAVIPAKNEAKGLKKLMARLPLAELDLIVPVLNGCNDNSLALIKAMNCPRLAPLCFKEALGIDVPRAVGAVFARRLGASGVLFVDGDMGGVGMGQLQQLIRAVQQGEADLALTNCYPANQLVDLSLEAGYLIQKRVSLNQHLNLYEKIGSATPSHGPHAVSARLLQIARPTDFAVPPLLLVRAAQGGLQVGVHAEIPHLALGSPWRGNRHAHKILETIIGDYLSALNTHQGLPGARSMAGKEYVGYHNQRRWDLLASFVRGELKGDCH